MSEFHGEIDIGLQCGPGSKVAKLRSVELRMEAEVGSDAGVRVCGLVAVVRAGDHEPGLTGGQILDHREDSTKVIARYILDGDAQPVALVHQQGATVGSDARHVYSVGTGRAGGNAIGLDEGKVGRLSAIGIELSVVHRFDTVDVQRRTPVGQVATDLGDEGGIAGGIELHLEECRPSKVRIVLVAIGDAGPSQKT